MTGRRHIQRLRVLALFLALAALAVLILQIVGWLPSEAVLISDAFPVTTDTPSPAPRLTFVQASKPTPDIPLSTTASLALTMTLSGPITPADEWANALLDIALPLLEQALPSGGGFAWWQGSDAGGMLMFVGERLLLGSLELHVDDQQVIGVLIPNHENPNQLDLLASIEPERGVLVLSVVDDTPPYGETRWLVSNAYPGIALTALAVQAERRGVALRAAFNRNPGGEAQLALVGIAQLAPTPTFPIPSGTEHPTPTASRTPTTTFTTTPTREPDVYLGRLIAEKIDPIIDAALFFDTNAVFDFAGRHPWTGILSWTETGAEIGGRPTAVCQATELTFYTLKANDPSGEVRRFLRILYVDGATRFPDDQVYFQGQRMEEILFWLVRRAAEREGQLIVAYDDFGAKQAITIVGFRSFPTPGQ